MKYEINDDGFFFQAEDGIRDLVRSRGLGDVYKRQAQEALDYFVYTMGPQNVTFQTTAIKTGKTPVYQLSLIHI